MNEQLPNPADQITARGPLFYLGAGALLIAMAVDAVAVAGRHIGLPLLGSLELVQAAILLASSSALVSATLARRHASARFLVDRVSPRLRAVMQHISGILTFLFFAALAAGQVWIAAELWYGHEDSELLHIPYAPLRIASVAAVILTALIVLKQILVRPRP
jgi:TRAP-type C4-dicarboxylate transport system permease small subunit